MAGVKGKSGGARPNSGRKSIAEEQKLVERLGPLQDLAHQKLKAALQLGEQWAVKMYFEYMYGKPTQRIEQTGANGGPMQHEIKHLADYTDEEVMDLAEQVAQYKKAQDID